jgi:hypothetical protein
VERAKRSEELQCIFYLVSYLRVLVEGELTERPKAASGTGPAKDTATENSEPPTDEEASQRVRSTTTGSAAEPRGRRAQVAESRRSAPLQNAASLSSVPKLAISSHSAAHVPSL